MDGLAWNCAEETGPSSVRAPYQLGYPLPPPQSRAPEVLPEDVKTPDSHMARDERLIRLTRAHPFNVKAPLGHLFDQGFLTGEDLHYVRNHGAVPRCDDGDALDWTLMVEGFEQLTLPVTLVCAGNRRKEQNVVRKSKGFSWGPAGLSTALWTGPTMGDVLARARPLRGARYVCLEGADRLPNDCYGTSVRLGWCMDAGRDILMAHRMNGRPLHPDHGKPLRVVAPGQIGGRSVKWLKRIVVTAEPSDNWYHVYDNRVLPTSVTPEASANMAATWRDERYAIYDLNTNNAICCPAHDERVPLPRADAADPAPSASSSASHPLSYKVCGYAYSGGGRRITRVEVTLDRGSTWCLADVDYPEDRYRLAPEGHILYGGRLDVSWRDTSFCWCFWELDVSLADLEAAADIMGR